MLVASLVNSYIKRKKFEASIIAQAFFGKADKDKNISPSAGNGIREISASAMLERIA